MIAINSIECHVTNNKGNLLQPVPFLILKFNKGDFYV